MNGKKDGGVNGTNDNDCVEDGKEEEKGGKGEVEEVSD